MAWITEALVANILPLLVLGLILFLSTKADGSYRFKSVAARRRSDR